MPAPPFDTLRKFFTDDCEYGQLCDIVVPDATPHVWAALFRIVAANYPHRFEIGSKDESWSATLPVDPSRLLADANSPTGPWPSLSFDLAGLPMRVHFAFGASHLEIDCERSAITPERYAAIAEFMQRLGDASGHNVYITPESHLAAAEMLYEPARRCFRRPRRGEGATSGARERIRAALADALRPFREAASSPPPRWPRRHEPLAPTLPMEVFVTALDAVDAIRRRYDEAVLQDDLPLDERERLDQAWSLLATIARPAEGTNTAPYRPIYVRDLVRLAHDVARS